MSDKFWRPGTVAPGSTLERENADEHIITTSSMNPNNGLAMKEQRKRLPIYKYRRELLYLIENYQTVVIIGETGCGKTTQIPQYLYESGWSEGGRCVVCTQPRRIAASSVAKRVAEEMNVRLGNEVGYSVRFDRVSQENTRIKFCTDGMLVREMLRDPLLSRYSAIMIDEAHERSLYTDLLLGLIKQIMKQRSELRVIVASATLDAKEFANFFNTKKEAKNPTSTILSVEGRMFPVDTHYVINPLPHYVKGVVDTVFQIHQSEPAGDILVFLTGQDEVDETINLIDDRASSHFSSSKFSLRALPMYSTLPSDFQARIFLPTPPGTRKVIVATNIAETSVTIPNIVYVIDSGFMKMKAYNAINGMESLIVTPVSQASAIQRAGRAGRVKPGKCYRLYTENAFLTLAQRTPPAMQRTNLAIVCLQLKALGIDNLVRFDFLSPPPAEALIRAMDLLYSLGAIDKNCCLTIPRGERIVELPLDPKLSKMLLVSTEFGCSEEILTISAMLQLENVFLSPPDSRKEATRKKMLFAAEEGDHLTLLNLYKAFEKHGSQKWCYRNFINRPALLRAKEIRNQLVGYIKRYEIEIVSCGIKDDVIRKCIVSGYFSNAAKLKADGTYESVREKQILHLHPSSVLYNEKPPPWITFYEVVLTDRAYARDVTVIDPSWLPELAPHFYEFNKFVKVES